MAHGPRGGLGALIAAKIVCCGGLALVLVAGTGAPLDFAAWLTGGGYLWLGAAAGAVLLGLALYRRPSKPGGGGTESLRSPSRRVP